MTVKELLSRARDTLQDQEATYWDDSELLNYYNECKRIMSAERLEIKTTATMTLDPIKTDNYDTTGILRYLSATDDLDNKRTLYPDDDSGLLDVNGIIIKDYNKVFVIDSTVGTTITFEVVSLPPEDNITGTVRFGDENAIRYYILSKAYEKETDTEDFSKATYFYQKYENLFEKLMSASNANYRASTVTTTKSVHY